MSAMARAGLVFSSLLCCVGLFGLTLGYGILILGGGLHGVEVNSVNATVRAVEPETQQVTVRVVIPLVPESVQGGYPVRTQVPWRSDAPLPEVGATVMVHFQNYETQPHSVGPVGEPGPSRIGSILWDTGLAVLLLAWIALVVGGVPLTLILQRQSHTRRPVSQQPPRVV